MVAAAVVAQEAAEVVDLVAEREEAVNAEVPAALVVAVIAEEQVALVAVIAEEQVALVAVTAEALAVLVVVIGVEREASAALADLAELIVALVVTVARIAEPLVLAATVEVRVVLPVAVN